MQRYDDVKSSIPGLYSSKISSGSVPSGTALNYARPGRYGGLSAPFSRPRAHASAQGLEEKKLLSPTSPGSATEEGRWPGSSSGPPMTSAVAGASVTTGRSRLPTRISDSSTPITLASSSNLTLRESHGAGRVYTSSTSMSNASQYAFDPTSFYTDGMNAPEPDDDLHTPDKKGDKNVGISCKGLFDTMVLIFLALALAMIFAGYPVLRQFLRHHDLLAESGLGPGGTNGTGQTPQLDIRHLIDPETPSTAQTWQSSSGDAYNLVFSDEFNTQGRTFWPGDDPYWEAVDIWYGATGDTEWYSPEAVNTTGGSLVISMTEKKTHFLNFQSGMLQSWNKFCFQGGYIEFNVLQPGSPSSTGYWPAVWLMGNLGRPGYLASTDGMWPYSYQSCDTGILKNQSYIDGTGPEEALRSKAPFSKRGTLSYLPGMRASACTCSFEDHPGPNRQTGRSAPEIDIIEAQIQADASGEFHSDASQSLQTAPFDALYLTRNTSRDITIFDEDITQINNYHGGVYQEAVSAVTRTPDRNHPTTGNAFVRYGVEYEPDWKGDGSGFTRWYMDGKPTWEVRGSALGPSAVMDIGQRTIPTEPMSIVLNMGMSGAFQDLHFDGERAMTFPAKWLIDYVRVYQLAGRDPMISCDPPDHPTAAYIARHHELYYNRNLTIFPDRWPLNKITAKAAGVAC